MKALYTAIVTSTGGRDGRAVSHDGNLDVALSVPKALGGAGGNATNPEQLFAAGYSACFDSAIRHAARARKVAIQDLSVSCEVSIGAAASGVGFALAAHLKVLMPGHDSTLAASLIEQAHQICPYSNATRGNINVDIDLVQAL